MPLSKVLNVTAVQEAMQRAGLNAAQLAEQLGVSRQSTNTWVQGKAQPRPDKVLKMARILKMKFEEIYESCPSQQVNEPVVAFRRKARQFTTDEHREHAKRMGKVMERLVPGLPFDEFDAPTRIKHPSLDYDYIQRLVTHLRKQRNVSSDGKIAFEDLISEFAERQAVIVPVMWGSKSNHGNGLHIYLPESQVTWVYLNLESNLLDFKYWMAHELGHILIGENSKINDELFCESFAAALLFPRKAVVTAYARLGSLKVGRELVNTIKALALEYEISPITVGEELNRHAVSVGKPTIEFGNVLFKIATSLNKQFPKVSELVFGSSRVDPGRYVEGSRKVFGNLFFDSLKRYLTGVDDGGGFVQWALDIPLTDAKGIAQALRYQ